MFRSRVHDFSALQSPELSRRYHKHIDPHTHDTRAFLCAHKRVHICTGVDTHMHAHTNARIHIHRRIHPQTHAHTKKTGTHTYAGSCTHIHAHTPTHITHERAPTYTPSYTHIHASTQTRIHRHTHARTNSHAHLYTVHTNAYTVTHNITWVCFLLTTGRPLAVRFRDCGGTIIHDMPRAKVRFINE